MSDFTPGPWRFEINPTTHSVKLISHAPLRPYVMGFERYGMQSAQPTLRVDGRMTKASEISEPEEGREHHAHWHQLINHPDANLIEAAPELRDSLRWFVDKFGPAIDMVIHKKGGGGMDAVREEKRQLKKAQELLQRLGAETTND